MNKDQDKMWRVILSRWHAELFLKLVLMVALNLWVYVPYVYLQRHHFFPAIDMPRNGVDRLIPFWDGTTWFYFSIYLLMPIGPFLMNRREQLMRYAGGIVFISLMADAIFLFCPTRCLRPDYTGTNIAYEALIRCDNEYHAFPSLHAAFAVYSVLCSGMVLKELGIRQYWQMVLWCWALLILYATLATKQHVLIDIAVGGLMGMVIYFWVFSKRIFISKGSPALQPVDVEFKNPHSKHL
jgi:membrane-associated phospholipid phosphatase